MSGRWSRLTGGAPEPQAAERPRVKAAADAPDGESLALVGSLSEMTKAVRGAANEILGRTDFLLGRFGEKFEAASESSRLTARQRDELIRIHRAAEWLVRRCQDTLDEWSLWRRRREGLTQSGESERDE